MHLNQSFPRGAYAPPTGGACQCFGGAWAGRAPLGLLYQRLSGNSQRGHQDFKNA